MRFVTAWADVANQNVTLRIVSAGMSLALMFCGYTISRLSLRPPLIIDRGCTSNVAEVSSNGKHTIQEIESFLRVALSDRFNTNAPLRSPYLSTEETRFRDQEQAELGKRQITQRLIINKIDINGSTATIDSDRLFTLGKLRSVVAFPLSATISEENRTSENPFGLVIDQVTGLKAGSEN